MSWDSYVQNLTAQNTLTDVAITDKDGNVWAKSNTFSASQSELTAISNGFREPGQLITSGIMLGNEKYMYLRSTDDNILGKKKNDGVCAALCNRCMLVGVYKDGQAPGAANNSIMKMADYLKGVGY